MVKLGRVISLVENALEDRDTPIDVGGKEMLFYNAFVCNLLSDRSLIQRISLEHLEEIRKINLLYVHSLINDTVVLVEEKSFHSKFLKTIGKTIIKEVDGRILNRQVETIDGSRVDLNEKCRSFYS